MNGPEIEPKKLPGPIVAFLLGLAMLLVMLPANAVGTPLFDPRPRNGVIAGAVLMLAAILCHRAGKQNHLLYLLALLLNGVGNGFSLSAVYIKYSLSPALAENVLGLAPGACALLLWGVLLLLLPNNKGIAAFLCGLVTLAAFLLSLLYLVMRSTVAEPFWYFGMISLIPAAVFMVPMGRLAGHPERNTLRDTSLAGFGAFILITIVVVFLLSGGEGLDGPDFIPASSGSAAKNKKPRDR